MGDIVCTALTGCQVAMQIDYEKKTNHMARTHHVCTYKSADVINAVQRRIAK